MPRRYAAKVDDNQREVVAAFRAVGASVLHLHSVGNGCPDLLVGLDGYSVLVEVKDGRKVPSARKLTPLEDEFAQGWLGGMVVLVECPEDALHLVQWLRGTSERPPRVLGGPRL